MSDIGTDALTFSATPPSIIAAIDDVANIFFNLFSLLIEFKPFPNLFFKISNTTSIMHMFKRKQGLNKIYSDEI